MEQEAEEAGSCKQPAIKGSFIAWEETVKIWDSLDLIQEATSPFPLTKEVAYLKSTQCIETPAVHCISMCVHVCV